jgi:MYXO-CTERM domain-containing protein
MHPSRICLFGALLVAALDVSSTARADVPPTCSAFDSDVTCSASDVGQPCSGGGTCYEVYCSLGSVGSPDEQNLYKCETCPTVLDVDAGADGGSACSLSSFGQSCAGGLGVCEKAPEWCPFTGAYLPCIAISDAGTQASSDAAVTTAASDAGGTAAQGDAGAPEGDSGSTSAGGSPSSASSGGCSTSPVANRGRFAAGLGLAGMIALLLGRRRRSRA